MIHIKKFIDRLQMLEAKNTKTFVMKTSEAKDLHADITKLLLAVEELRSQQDKSTIESDEIIKVEMHGEKW